MCDNSKDDYFNDIYTCENPIEDKGTGEYVISGKTNAPNGSMILYWAANPPSYNTSYSGSGLPFPSPDIAFDNTPNRGAVKIKDNKFKFNIRYPGSFYAGLGSYYITPHIYYKICNSAGKESKVYSVQLGYGIPFRNLTYPPPPSKVPRDSPIFYDGRDNLPIRTQEQILRDSGYPIKNITPDNFWGLSVPN